jgi:hypothetical protein
VPVALGVLLHATTFGDPGATRAEVEKQVVKSYAAVPLLRAVIQYDRELRSQFVDAALLKLTGGRPDFTALYASSMERATKTALNADTRHLVVIAEHWAAYFRSMQEDNPALCAEWAETGRLKNGAPGASWIGLLEALEDAYRSAQSRPPRPDFAESTDVVFGRVESEPNRLSQEEILALRKPYLVTQDDVICSAYVKFYTNIANMSGDQTAFVLGSILDGTMSSMIPADELDWLDTR